MLVAVQNGLANEYLWPNWQQGGDISFLIMASLATATILTFMRAMLNTRISFPRIDGWLKWSVRLFCISLIWIFVSPRGAVLLMPVMYLLALFLIFGVSLYCLRKKQRSAALFLLAFSMLMVGAVMAILTGLGWVPVSHFNSNAMQIGSAMEMLLLAFALADRLNSLLREKAHAQQQALTAQQLLLENLHTSEQVLEQRVAERTSELSQSNASLAKTNSELDAMYQRIEASRQQAQDAQAQATQAQAALLMAQDQMIHADKMASLGQLISSVGEEINQALASIQSSGKQMAKALYHCLSGMPPLLRQLDRATMTHFLRLIETANTSTSTPSTALTAMQTATQTATPGQSETDVESQTRLLLQQHPAARAMLKMVQSIALVKENSAHIKAAVQRVGKIVRALKSFSHVSPNGVLIQRHLVEDMETVLVIYQNLIEGKNRLVCQFDKIDALYYQPEKLNQVWIGLIQNALQAMQQPGTLTIGIHRVGNEAVVSIGDTGCGIAEDILVNIFEPLLITRHAGSGGGIGLDIVKHIIDQHHGRIEIQSQLGVGTTVSVFLPYEA